MKFRVIVSFCDAITSDLLFIYLFIYFYLLTVDGRPESEYAIRHVMSSEQTNDDKQLSKIWNTL